MIMNLDKIAREVHALAIEKGWWISVLSNTTPPRGNIAERDVGELLMLAVSELGEAMEEIRKPDFEPELIYYAISEKVRIRHPPTFSIPDKPEGFPIEIADCVIRLLDTCCALDIELQDRYEASRWAIGFISQTLPIGSHLMKAVADLSQAFLLESPAFPGFALKVADCIARLDRLSEARDIDLGAAIMLKHQFNKTRPFRHGNKRA